MTWEDQAVHDLARFPLPGDTAISRDACATVIRTRPHIARVA